jgi:glucose/arabinose dehydrogenase
MVKYLYFVIIVLSFTLPLHAQDEEQFEPIIEAGDLQRPVLLTHAGDERLFVIEQVGRIRIIEDGQLLETPFLDIQPKVTRAGNEQGLLGLAFDPNYAESGAFYVNYTSREGDGDTVVARYQVSDDPNVADPDSEQVILNIEQPYENHNGGMLAFGPDGYLYIGMGDGGAGGDPLGNGQNLGALLGKMLRIDVSTEPYSIPEDNPFVDNADAMPEIWSYGWRNPWRFSFDRETGDFYIADVGQGEIEEVNFQPADSTGGENYGWNVYEGSQPYEGGGDDAEAYVFPFTEYDHSQGCSVTGGYVYRGTAVPELVGRYFFADYCSGVIWTAQRDGEEWMIEEFASWGAQISSFGEDVNGELYVLTFDQGQIYKIVGE